MLTPSPIVALNRISIYYCFCVCTALPEMLEISPNGNNFDIYPTSMITIRVSFTLSPVNDISTTGILNDSEILQVKRNLVYNLVFACLEKKTTFIIGAFLFIYHKYVLTLITKIRIINIAH